MTGDGSLSHLKCDREPSPVTSKGKLIINRMEYGTVKYWGKKNRLYLSAGRMGYYSDSVYKLSSGVLKPVKEGSWESADAVMDHAVNCRWNGASVSLSQYRN